MTDKTIKGRKWDALGIALAAAVPAGIGMWVSPVYGFNDDVMMRSILSGTYSGTPDGHAVYMRYPLTGILSTLYRVSSRIPWLTLFFAGCMAVCLFLILKTVCESLKGRVYRILGVTLTAEVLIMLLARHYFVMHYTIVAALLGGTAILLYAKKRRTGSLLLLSLCYMVRSQVFFMALPFLLVAALWEFAPLLFREKIRSENVRSRLVQCGRYAAVLAVGILCLSGLHRIMYGTEQWKEYQEYNDARTELYDYADILPYENYREIYEQLGISEEQYQVLEQYDAVLDMQISTEQLGSLAQAAKEAAAEQIGTRELLAKRFQEYYYRTLHETDYPYNAVVLVLYGVLLICCVWKKQWMQGILVLLTGAGRSMIWLYLMMRGRYPERVTVSLYLIEALLLAGLCLSMFDRADAEPETNEADRERTGRGSKPQLYAAAAGLLVFALCMPAAWGTVKRGLKEAEEQRAEQETWEELREYMQEHPKNFYYIDVYSVVSVSGMQYERTEYENYMLLGGWMTRSALQLEKQQQTGYFSALQALGEGENIYLVMKKDRSVGWLEDYAASVDSAVSLQAYDRVGEYVIYAGVKP